MLPFVPELSEFEYSLVVQSDWESADCEKAKTEPHIVLQFELQSVSESELLAAPCYLIVQLCLYLNVFREDSSTSYPYSTSPSLYTYRIVRLTPLECALLHIFFFTRICLYFLKKKVCVVIGFLGSSLFIYSDLRTP